MDKRIELWDKVEELFINFEHHAKSPMQNDVKFIDKDIEDYTDMMVENINNLKDLTCEIIDYMSKNKVDLK